MAETLYRKYRPTTFSDVTEQDHIRRTIQNQIATDALAHAYLFSGPRGVGKTTIARLLAKAVNCTGRADNSSEPCNACANCLDFAEGRFLDTIEIDAASHTGVDNVRENVIENVRFVPQRGKYKVFIIDEVHMLSTSAFNALLKTLEEPPSHVIFIFATTELHKIPATIVSRCQRFDFHRIAADEMVVRLAAIAKKEGAEIDEIVLRSIAKLSEGCLRDAESLLGQVLSLGNSRITAEVAAAVLPMTTIGLVREILASLADKNLTAIMTTLAGFVADGGSVKQLVDDMIEEVRDLMLSTLSGQAGTFDAVSSRRLLDLLLTARNRQTLSLLPQLPLELALVEFILGGQTPPSPPMNGGVAPTPRPTGGLVAPRVDAPKKVTAGTAALGADSHTPAEALNFTLEEIQDKWERCCEYVADRNVALPLVLRAGKPTAINGNEVTIGFGYEFHADACRETKNIRLLTDAIAEVLLQRPIVRIAVVEQKTDSALADLTAAFGGSVVG